MGLSLPAVENEKRTISEADIIARDSYRARAKTRKRVKNVVRANRKAAKDEKQEQEE